MKDNYDYTGEKFLNRLYKDLNNSDEVNHVLPNGNKDEKVRRYLERLDYIENLAKNSKHNGIELLKDLYYKKYVIKPENVPESYFELQKKIALDRGYGHVNLTNEVKEEMIDSLIKNQEKSLDIWLDYLMDDDNTYPEWFKYYAFQGMLKLGNYNKEKGQFNKRTNKTTSIFAELDREALALTYNNLIKVLDGKNVSDEILQKLLEAGSFSKIYGYLIKKLNSQHIEINGNDGIWIKYNKGDNPNQLVNSLDGKRTGWCIAGYETAKEYLTAGDFYVYYTKNQIGEYKQPRIAIRMVDNEIAEIRGIAKEQNLESEMEDILEEKLKEFPDKDKYKKKVSDMKRLTEIYNQYQNRELTNDELRFLYEVDEKIIGFGYDKDPRIKEILSQRNLKKDLSKVLNCREDFISDDKNDVLSGKKLIYFHGDLEIKVKGNIKNIKLPEIVNGYLEITGVNKLENFKFPKMINGPLILDDLIEAYNVIFPKRIKGNLCLEKLERIRNVRFSDVVNGTVYLGVLEVAVLSKLPNHIDRILYLNNLKIAKGFILPKTLHILSAFHLKSVEGLVVPENFEYGEIISSYIAMEDLIAKSLESKEQSNKSKGYATPWLLLAITYIVSLIASFFIFMK